VAASGGKNRRSGRRGYNSPGAVNGNLARKLDSRELERRLERSGQLDFDQQYRRRRETEAERISRRRAKAKARVRPAQKVSPYQIMLTLCQEGGIQGAVVRAEPTPAPLEVLSPAEYAALREGLQTGRAHTAYTPDQLAFQKTLCPYPGSGLYRLMLAHGPGCAAVENWPDGPVVKELLCAPEDEGEGAAACAALCGGPIRARIPAGAEDGTPFGAVRWLSGRAPARWTAAPEGWLGLAFD